MATTTTKTATLKPVAGGTINATMTFEQTINDNGSGKVVITGNASGFASPTTVYVSLVYGVNSLPDGPAPCRDDGTLGGVILDPQDILAASDALNAALGANLGAGLPLLGPLLNQVKQQANQAVSNVLVPALQTGLGPLSPVNMPPPGGMLFSPKATARMFLGVWGLANGAGVSTFGPLTRRWNGPNDALAIPFTKINTVSIRQPQFPLLPNPVSDVRPQIFQLRACGRLE